MGAAPADPGGMQRGLREIPADAAGAGAKIRTGIYRLPDTFDFCCSGTKPEVKLCEEGSGADRIGGKKDVQISAFSSQ